MSIFGDFKYSRQWMMQLSLFGPFPPQEPECVLVCRKILILSLTQPNGILVLGVERVHFWHFMSKGGPKTGRKNINITCTPVLPIHWFLTWPSFKYCNPFKTSFPPAYSSKEKVLYFQYWLSLLFMSLALQLEQNDVTGSTLVPWALDRDQQTTV